MLSTRDRHGRSQSAEYRPETSDVGESDDDVLPRHRGKNATLFDAVAGRVTSTHALEDGTGRLSRLRGRRSRRAAQRLSRLTSSSSQNAVLAPEEVLFRRANAPVRYAERDIYFANERLPDGGINVLPDSDMLKALHVYASHFYARGQPDTGQSSSHAGDHDEQGNRLLRRKRATPIDEGSMDETAMLAFGIILEEASRELLGPSGDLVFTEGVDASDLAH
ncbi:hypothetical protein Micbo1qcDRAFT_69636 [Microdochium bolleyi]|uniref:Uncharacterized protein n=1 Tax=Microdochium bolleyi TaxID=196109 RepID=A0A136J1L0_9PEZI|nr:hypothetical protein Micbo1qcDRAFT_69636 [Microdochium bolleyi]